MGARDTEGPAAPTTRLGIVVGFFSGSGRRDASSRLEDGAGGGGAPAPWLSGALTRAVPSGGGSGAGCPEPAAGTGEAGVAVELAERSMKGIGIGRRNQTRTAPLTSTSRAPIHGQSRRGEAEDARCTILGVRTFAW